MFCIRSWWLCWFEYAPGALARRIGRTRHHVNAHLIHHGHIALCQHLMRHIRVEWTVHLGQLFLDLAGMMSVLSARHLYLSQQFIFREGKHSVKRLHQVHPSIEQNAPSIDETLL